MKKFFAAALVVLALGFSAAVPSTVFADDATAAEAKTAREAAQGADITASFWQYRAEQEIAACEGNIETMDQLGIDYSFWSMKILEYQLINSNMWTGNLKYGFGNIHYEGGLEHETAAGETPSLEGFWYGLAEEEFITARARYSESEGFFKLAEAQFHALDLAMIAVIEANQGGGDDGGYGQ